MTKKQQAERDAVWAHIVATTGAKPAEKMYSTDSDALQLHGDRRHGVRFYFAELIKGREFDARVTLTGYAPIQGPVDKSPIAAYNALCAAPFFATTVGVAFGLKPMGVS